MLAIVLISLLLSNSVRREQYFKYVNMLLCALGQTILSWEIPTETGSSSIIEISRWRVRGLKSIEWMDRNIVPFLLWVQFSA